MTCCGAQAGVCIIIRNANNVKMPIDWNFKMCNWTIGEHYLNISLCVLLDLVTPHVFDHLLILK